MLRRIAPALIVLMTLPAPAFAWGQVAHRYITRRAVDLLPAELRPFFAHYVEELALRSNDPDLWRLVFDEEAPNHQIDLGVADYGPYPFTALPRDYDKAVEKFGALVVRRNGLLPWRVEEEFGVLRRTFEAIGRGQIYADTNSVLYAAALSHYIGDAHQPLHVHNNYDGQLTGQNGLHSRFEAELFERFESRLTVNPAPAKPFADARDFIFDVAIRANQLVPKILQADKEAIGAGDTYDAAYFEAFFTKIHPVLEQQVAAAITATASAIVSAWEQAGRPNLRPLATRPIQKVRRP